MTARLKKFRITQFRSIADSGWIDVDEVTALIGTNESGKTNLLTGLWKLKPAKGGSINLLEDLPRKNYHALRNSKPMPVFVSAHFELDEDVVARICQVTGCSPEEVRIAKASRHFDGTNTIGFPNELTVRSAAAAPLLREFDTLLQRVEDSQELRGEAGIKNKILDSVKLVQSQLADAQNLDGGVLKRAISALSSVTPSQPMKTSSFPALLDDAVSVLASSLASVEATPPSKSQAARDIAWESIPPLVYYSQYGNLDSEIYLPHVIDNLDRDDLGIRDTARARTLKVLFQFVKISPQEILKLGRDVEDDDEPTDEELEAAALRKKEREVLLQSASADLTSRFREWWKQGDYQFRFQADGNHFRIWVSDERRPEQIELEGRSSGLQWFFSFYLVFLVEAEDSHEDAILLLDEPGLSLHPVSQGDLSSFFRGLAEKNQLLYTTHSPFMVDSDRLDRVKAVFTTDDGLTAISEDLRAQTKQGNSDRHNSIYPVHAALGLSVSDTLLQGCQVVIVEGASDQQYLSAIKTLLVASGDLRPTRDLVFVPAGGVKGVKAVAAILSSKENELPHVIVDGDDAGKQFAKHLVEGLYTAAKDRVLSIDKYYKEIRNPEIEDLVPTELLAYEATRLLRGPDPEFDEVVDAKKPICDQVERYAENHNLPLAVPGWKAVVAVRVKRRMLKNPEKLDFDGTEKGKAWKALFGAIVAETTVRDDDSG